MWGSGGIAPPGGPAGAAAVVFVCRGGFPFLSGLGKKTPTRPKKNILYNSPPKQKNFQWGAGGGVRWGVGGYPFISF